MEIIKKWLDIGKDAVVIAMAGTLAFTFFYFHLAPPQQTQSPAPVRAGTTLRYIGVSTSRQRGTL